jgi:hypothetical protein
MDFPRTCYYCPYEPIGRHNDVPVCKAHMPEKPPTKANAYTGPVDVDDPTPTPRNIGLFGPFG